MTVRDLILELLDHPLDAEVVRSAGSDPQANVAVTEITWGWTHSPNGRKKAVILR